VSGLAGEVLPFAEVHALRAMAVEIQRGCFGHWPGEADEVFEALAKAMRGDRYHHVFWWDEAPQGTTRLFVVRLRAGSLRTLGVLEKEGPNLWLYTNGAFVELAPSMWGQSIKHDRPLPRARYRKIATATAAGVPSALRLKPRSRLKFPCEAPANDVGATT